MFDRENGINKWNKSFNEKVSRIRRILGRFTFLLLTYVDYVVIKISVAIISKPCYAILGRRYRMYIFPYIQADVLCLSSKVRWFHTVGSKSEKMRKVVVVGLT